MSYSPLVIPLSLWVSVSLQRHLVRLSTGTAWSTSPLLVRGGGTGALRQVTAPGPAALLTTDSCLLTQATEGFLAERRSFRQSSRFNEAKLQFLFISGLLRDLVLTSQVFSYITLKYLKSLVNTDRGHSPRTRVLQLAGPKHPRGRGPDSPPGPLTGTCPTLTMAPPHTDLAPPLPPCQTTAQPPPSHCPPPSK